MTKPDKLDGFPDPEPGDIIMILRHGMAMLTIPDHDHSDEVSEDFRVALGMARAFNDDKFRLMMLNVCQHAIENGDLSDVMSFRPASVQ